MCSGMIRTPYALPGVPAPYLFIVFVLIAPVVLRRNPANDVLATLIISISYISLHVVLFVRDRNILKNNVVIIII